MRFDSTLPDHRTPGAGISSWTRGYSEGPTRPGRTAVPPLPAPAASSAALQVVDLAGLDGHVDEMSQPPCLSRPDEYRGDGVEVGSAVGHQEPAAARARAARPPDGAPGRDDDLRSRLDQRGPPAGPCGTAGRELEDGLHFGEPHADPLDDRPRQGERGHVEIGGRGSRQPAGCAPTPGRLQQRPRKKTPDRQIPDGPDTASSVVAAAVEAAKGRAPLRPPRGPGRSRDRRTGPPRPLRPEEARTEYKGEG